jgi:hypothetical protein
MGRGIDGRDSDAWAHIIDGPRVWKTRLIEAGYSKSVHGVTIRRIKAG